MASLQFSVGRGSSPLKRLASWWWVPAIPAGLLALFVVFLALNRVSNEFPEELETLPGGGNAAAPFEEAYVSEPELYFTVWQLDSQGDRASMIARWQAELDQLKVESMMGDGEEKDAQIRARRIQQLTQAIDDLHGRR